MRLGSADGDFLELSVVGYQFPDAEDPRQRYSWHMVEGAARLGPETWDFRWQALTCEESGLLVCWLCDAARATARSISGPVSGPARTSLMEPNLAFAVESYRDGMAALRIELDLEFRAPSNKPDPCAGRPTVLLLNVTAAELIAAAEELDADVCRYPDLSIRRWRRRDLAE